MWTASLHLGNFVGPTASGFLVEAIGFRNSTTIFFGIYCLMTVVNSIEFARKLRKEKLRKSRGYEEFKG